MDEKEYEEIFHKDDRNQRGGPNAKKRTNVKEVMRRLQQIEKRKGNPVQESSEEEAVEVEPRRKYDNGKPQRVVKVQEYYEEESGEEKKKAKKGKGK